MEMLTCDTRQQAKVCQASGIADIVVVKRNASVMVGKRNANCVVVNCNVR